MYKRRNCTLTFKSSFTKVKRIIPEKNYAILLLAIEYRQETVYELPRRNEVSFKAKAKRTTTKNKTNRKKQRKVELFA